MRRKNVVTSIEVLLNEVFEHLQKAFEKQQAYRALLAEAIKRLDALKARLEAL